jgi:hypothetical protein
LLLVMASRFVLMRVIIQAQQRMSSTFFKKGKVFF